MGGPAGAAYGAASAGSRAYGYARGDDASRTNGSPNGARSDYDFEGSAEEIDEDDPQLPR